jgi:hypothetical protein
MLVNGREALMPLVRLDSYGPLIGVWKDMLAAAPAPEGMTGLINAAVDDLKIDPRWHEGRTFDERRLINDAFQNGVEIAADAILAIIAKGEGR